MNASREARELARRIDALRATPRRTVSVGISGVDCAGKSTLARELAAELRGRGLPVLLVEGDELTRPTRERYADPDEGRGYYRESFAYDELFARVLPAARRGREVELSLRFSDWENDGWRPTAVTVPADGVVIAEGCFLFAANGCAEFDLSVWLELPLDQVVERALARPRDLERMGGPAGVRERYETRYLPGQRLHLAADAPATHADVVVPA